MENGTKALLIAGAILVVILIIAVGMFVTNNATSTINDSIGSMSTQEIEAFNLKFTMYEGEQTGANIKALVGTLIANSNTNKSEISKIPGVFFENSDKTYDSGIPESDSNSEYISGLENIKKNIDTKHKYWVEMSFQDNGLLDYINISYDKSNKIEPMFRK